MKRRVILWLCLALLVSALIGLGVVATNEHWLQRLWANRPMVTKIEPGYYRVTHVYDGDTILVDMDGALEKVRFIGVDTPETHDPDVGVQCFGPEASNYTTELLQDETVRLESDSTNSNRDRYDRLLRYVYAEDGTLVNESLIVQGYGFAYTRFPFIKKDDFVTAETQARESDTGLWGACTPYVNSGGIYQTNEVN